MTASVTAQVADVPLTTWMSISPRRIVVRAKTCAQPSSVSYTAGKCSLVQ